MKRLTALMLTVIFIISLSISVSAQSDGVLSFRRIYAEMPVITAELKGSEYSGSQITASWDSEALTVESVAKYDKSVHTTRAYILLDLSVSMKNQLMLVKQCVYSFIDFLGEKDEPIIITFDDKNVSVVNTSGMSKQEIKDAVSALECTGSGTLFYEALDKAYEMSSSAENTYDREYVLAFSDGADMQKGSVTFDEAVKKYGENRLPLYAACPHSASKQSVDKFGEIARSSGGDLSLIASTEDCNSFIDLINDVTMLTLKSSNNRMDGQVHNLSIKAGDLQITKSIHAAGYKPDDTIPVISKIEYSEENKSIIVKFSEKVENANVSDNYILTDSKKNSYKIQTVKAIVPELEYELIPSEIYNGKYTLKCSGITDISAERHSVQSVMEFEVVKAGQKTEMGLIGVVVAVFVMVIAIVVIIIIAVSKSDKKVEEYPTVVQPPQNPIPAVPTALNSYEKSRVNQVQHHIMADNMALVRLVVKTGKSAEQKIEATITGSLIVGRSDMCDVYIDDTKLSRQHFVIELSQGKLYLTDLKSRNGTFVNGTAVISRRLLNNGDKIFAGLSEITVFIV